MLENISVITTVRNGGRFILDMLESVNNQNFRNFEHIVVDDGSEDDTTTIVENFQKQHPNYNLLLFQPKLYDRGKALNFAVSKAKAEWIAIIDADDLWHPDKLKIQYKIAQQGNYDVIATKAVTFTNTNNINYATSLKDAQCSIISMEDMLKLNIIPHSSVLIKKQFCNYDINRKSQYDYELWLRLLSKGCVIAKINQELYYKRLHKQQSFEVLMGRSYIWRVFVLQIIYSFKSIKFLKLYPYFICQLIFRLFLPRNIKRFIRSKLTAIGL